MVNPKHLETAAVRAALVLAVAAGALLHGSFAEANEQRQQAAPARPAPAPAPAARPAPAPAFNGGARPGGMAGQPMHQGNPGAVGQPGRPGYPGNPGGVGQPGHPGVAGQVGQQGRPGTSNNARTPITTTGGGMRANGPSVGQPGHPGQGVNSPAGRSAAAAPPARAFGGHPAPVGSRVAQAANGSYVRSRPNGARSDVHDPQRGMDIHHSLNGTRQVAVERADHSRIVASSHGGGYVQRPYAYHGHEFGHRAYYENGRAYDRYYHHYPYYGVYYDVYAPYRYYPYGYYGWAYYPWAAPVPYAWGWYGAPWYGYYGAYYAPAPVYVSSSVWLADFLLAATLQAAYVAEQTGQAEPQPAPFAQGGAARFAMRLEDFFIARAEAAGTSTPALTPEVRTLLAAELQAAVQLEGEEAKANAQNRDVDPSSTSVFHLLGDGKPHVFVAGQELDLVAATGEECAVTPGDVLRVSGLPPQNATTVDATVLASKGGKECAIAAQVALTLADLQEMHNHLRSNLDEGLAELQSKQGKGGIPAAPADALGAPATPGYAASAPPADPDPAGAIKAQLAEADRAESEAAGGSDGVAAAAAPSAPPPTITLGQSMDQIRSALGAPPRIIDLGAKKTWVYSDMKIIFVNGKVADVQ